MTRIGLFCAPLLLAAMAHGQVVISQVYGGGQGGTAVYKNDYVELFNPTGTDVSLSGWSIQYQAAGSTGNWSGKVSLSGTIAANKYFLVQMSSSSGSGASALDLPAPDFASTAVSMAAASAKVALVSSTGTISTAAGPPVVCPSAAAGVVDLVGYGTANCAEGPPAPGLSAATAAFRANGGCSDTSNNSTDFAAAAPSPRNSASAAHVCGSATDPTATGSADPSTVTAGSATTLSATAAPGSSPPSTNLAVSCNLTAIGGSSTFALVAGSGTSFSSSYTVPAGTAANTYSLPCTVTDDQSRSGPFTIGLTVAAAPPTFRLISEINGSGTASPVAGTTVRTRGVVSAVRGTTGSTKGFYIEALASERDADPATSEGLLVFIGSASLPACAAAGNYVQIDGTVSDFVPGTAPLGSVPLTELASVTNCTVLGSDTLPAPVTITSSDIAAGGSATQARRFLGMRVLIPQAVTVGASLGNVSESSATATASGVFFVTLAGVTRPFRREGILATRRPSDAAATVPSYNGSPEVLRIDTSGLTGGTAFEVGNGTAIQNISGIMDYDTSDGVYQVYTNLAGIDGGALPAAPVAGATPVPTQLSSDLTIANFNLQRFYNDVSEGNGAVTLATAAYQGRLNKLSLAVRNVLRMPDIITFEEVEGWRVGASEPTVTVAQDIVNKINGDAAAAGQGNPAYDWCEFSTNDPSAISIAVMFKTGKVSKQECTQFGAGTLFAKPAGGSGLLNDRPPVMFLANVKAPGSDSALPVRIVANHLRSFGDVDARGDTGDFPRAKRNEQAKYVANLVSGNLAGEQTADWNATDNLVVTGDFNAYEFSDGYVDSLNCVAGIGTDPAKQYFSAAEFAVSQPCPSIFSPALTNLTAADPLQRYSYSFSGAAQRIDHILVNSKMNSRVRQFVYARNDVDFPEGPTYRNDFNRPERVSDHDAPVVYLKLPMEVTSRTRLNASALFLNRATGRYNGTISVTNTGAPALTGPIYVFFRNLPAGVSLPDLPVYNGAPYATINVAGLAAGATSGTVVISFANPSNARISYTTERFDVNY